jgi:Mg2+/Co2+ transporter CorC
MIRGVLTLAERTVKSIMTPRTEIGWLDVDAGQEALRRRILERGHSRFLLARGNLDQFLGVALSKDLLRDLLEKGRIDLERSLRQPLVVHESVNALRLIELLRNSPLQPAVVLDEHGSVEGIATPIDVLEAIAGDFPDEGEARLTAERAADGSWLVDGWIDIRRLSSLIGIDLVDEADRYSTLAGYVLWRLGHLPKAGDRVAAAGLTFAVVAMDGHNIDKVRIHPGEAGRDPATSAAAAPAGRCERWPRLWSDGAMFERLKRTFHELKDGEPGRRFTAHHERHRRTESHRESTLKTAAYLIGGFALLLGGLLLSLPPGVPGFLLWVPALGLLAARLRVVAVGLDRAELLVHRLIGKR